MKLCGTRLKIERLVAITIAFSVIAYVFVISSDDHHGKAPSSDPLFKPKTLTDSNLEKMLLEAGQKPIISDTPLHSKIFNMGTPRRNQECMVIGEGDDSVVVQIGGLDIPNVEYYHVKSGHVETIKNDMINLNHFAMAEKDGLLYCMCSLKGDGKYTYGTPSENIIIYDLATKSVRTGPRFRIVRKECGVVRIDQVVVKKVDIVRVEELVSNETFSKLPDSWTEDVICQLGGSLGYHDLSTFTAIFDCYSSIAGGWIVLPDAPLKLDHHNTNKMQQILADGSVEDVVIMNSGRLGNYTGALSSVYRFSLSTNVWQFLFNASIPRSASSSQIVFNRYLIIIGGVNHRTGGSPGRWSHTIFKDIDVCDMETHVCHVVGKLTTQRFGCRACMPKSQREIYVCGGTDDGLRNVPVCEVFDTLDLIRRFMAMNEDGTRADGKIH